MAFSPPRVTGGQLKGRRLFAPATGTRPTTARLRDSIFNRLDVRSCLDAPVLDLYAGAGFFGIEALSRGAPGVDFVERDRTACDVIRRNLATLEISAGARVLCLSAERAIRRLQGPYGLCFVDPPYREDATAVAEAVVHMGLLAPTALVLWRHPRSRPAPEALGTLARRDTRRYGDAVLETYRLAVGDPSPGQDESAP